MSRKMKSSALSWVRDVPSEWGIGKIKHIYSVTLGKMISPTQTDISQTLENYLCAANIKWNGIDTSVHKQMWFNRSEKGQYLLEEGDVLIMEGGTVGTATIYHGEFAPCYIQNSVHKCHGKNLVANKFLYYWMHVVQNSGYVDTICNKATIQHYTKDKVKETPCVIVPEKEQQAIVRYLDSKCSAIDEAIERHKKIIEKLEEYWKSVVWTEINSHVDTTGKLKILFELHRGYDLTANSFVNGSVPVYGSGGFVGYHNEAKCVGPNVVIGRSGSTGKLTYVPDAVFWAHNTGIYVSDFRRNIPKYVYYLLLTIDIDSLANKTAVPTLDRKNVQNYVASFTTNTEQQNSIVDKLDVLYESIQKSKTIHEKSITKLEEYRKSIIYNAVTGKIDCRTEAVE